MRNFTLINCTNCFCNTYLWNLLQRRSWLWCLLRFLNYIVYWHSLSKRWLFRIIDSCKSNRSNHECVFLTYFVCIRNFFIILMFYFIYHPNTWYSLPVTVCLCVQCSWLHKENLLTSFAKQEDCRRFTSRE